MNSRLLAEVEGIDFRPCDCGETGCLEQDMIPDYPNDLEACMRVARKLNVAVMFDWPCEFIYMIDENGVEVGGDVKMTDPNNPTATLYPMLVEIAEERKE